MFSNIEIWPTKDQSKNTKAFGRVTVADAVNINISVVQGKNGLFVSFPSHLGKDKQGKDKWYSDVFIEDKKILADLNKKVVEAFSQKTGKDNLDQGEAPGPTNQDNIPFG